MLLRGFRAEFRSHVINMLDIKYEHGRAVDGCVCVCAGDVEAIRTPAPAVLWFNCDWCSRDRALK